MLAATRGILALRAEREHEVSVCNLAVGPRLEIEVLGDQDASALAKVENGDGYGCEETLVAAFELVLIKDYWIWGDFRMEATGRKARSSSREYSMGLFHGLPPKGLHIA